MFQHVHMRFHTFCFSSFHFFEEKFAEAVMIGGSTKWGQLRNMRVEIASWFSVFGSFTFLRFVSFLHFMLAFGVYDAYDVIFLIVSSLLSLFHTNPDAEGQGWDSCKIKID